MLLKKRILIGIADELRLGVDSQSQVGTLDVILHGVHRYVQCPRYLFVAAPIIQEAHDTQFSLAEPRIKLGVTYCSLQWAFAPSRALHLLEAPPAIVHVYLSGVEVSEIALAEPPDDKELIVGHVERTLPVFLLQGLVRSRVEVLDSVEEHLHKLMLGLVHDLTDSLRISVHQVTVNNEELYSVHTSETPNFSLT